MNSGARTHVGHYSLKRRLGSGGMGVVWLAFDPRSSQRVAIKLLSPDLAHDLDHRRRLRREADLASSLRSPHIVQVLDYGISNGQPYFVMEYVPGTTLDDYAASRGMLPVHEAVDLIKQAAQGLAVAHAGNVLHGDIKAQNLMLSSGVVKVMDFGIARDIDADWSTTSLMGTPAYMSPEQGREDPTDERSDLYSLGVVLYLLLSGSLPFQAEKVLQTEMMHARDPVPSLRERRAELPVGAAVITERLLAKRPEDRYQSATELIKALDSWKTQAETESRLPEPTAAAQPLPLPPTAPAVADDLPGPSCVQCGTANRSGLATCQQCGARLGVHYPGFWLRFKAAILDAAIAGGVTLNLLFARLVWLLLPGDHSSPLAEKLIASWWIYAWILPCWWLYGAVMESSGRQATLGKLACALIVTDLDQQRLSLLRALGRNFAKVISLAVLGLGFLTPVFSGKKQQLQDIMAGCLVIQRPSTGARLPQPVQQAPVVPPITLKVVDGNSDEWHTEFPVRETPTIIGRGQEDDITINGDLNISRGKILLSYDRGEEAWAISDLGARNPLVVNGHEVSMGLLARGDRVCLGETVLEVIS